MNSKTFSIMLLVLLAIGTTSHLFSGKWRRTVIIEKNTQTTQTHKRVTNYYPANREKTELYKRRAKNQSRQSSNSLSPKPPVKISQLPGLFRSIVPYDKYNTKELGILVTQKRAELEKLIQSKRDKLVQRYKERGLTAVFPEPGKMVVTNSDRALVEIAHFSEPKLS